MSGTFTKFIDNDNFSDDTEAIAILKTAIQFEGQAKVLAPKDTHRLEQSIQKSKDGNDYLVGTNVEYAADVEFGTKYQDPQPFMRSTAYLLQNKGASEKDFNNFLGNIK